MDANNGKNAKKKYSNFKIMLKTWLYVGLESDKILMTPWWMAKIYILEAFSSLQRILTLRN